MNTIISSFQDHQNGSNFCFSKEHLSRTEHKLRLSYPHLHSECSYCTDDTSIILKKRDLENINFKGSLIKMFLHLCDTCSELSCGNIVGLLDF